MLRNENLETFFASCPRGLEPLLIEELSELGAVEIRMTQGGVGFRGKFSLCYQVNLESRIASRVLWQISSSKYSNEEDVYQVAYSLPWSAWFTVKQTIKVNLNAKECPLKSLDYATLRIKDAVCDAFVKQITVRPTVNTRTPDIRIVGFLDANTMTLYLDTSGEPLFKRGWRKATGPAPLRENLAAGLLRLSGWSKEQVLVDPMCGSATILVEAVKMARGIAPGFGRRFAFECLKNFDRTLWHTVKETSRVQQSPSASVTVYGYDRDETMMEAARVNLQNTGLSDTIVLQRKDILDLTPPASKGIVLTNPPYGLRLDEEERLAQLYPRLGNRLKQQFVGWKAFLFTADRRLPKLIRLSPSRRIPLYNGDLECRLYEFALVQGGNRKSSRAKHDSADMKNPVGVSRVTE